MRYIKGITLENFQSHKYTDVKFDEKYNVIVGPSDSGKSAIIRAIKWALYNEPSGDYFIREGESECSVTLEFNDGSILKRYRNKSKNQYIFTKNNGEEMIFEGFGSKIPEDITDSIGIKKIYLDSDESNAINLGEQLEGPFLLSEKSSTRASAIGRLVGVNIIDDALKDVLKDTRALSITKKHLEENNKSLNEEIKEYDYLDDLKVIVARLSKIKDQISEKNKKLELYTNINNKLKKIIYEKEQANIIIDKLHVIDRLNDNLNYIEHKLLKFKYLNQYDKNLKRTITDIKEYSLIKTRLKNLSETQGNVISIENKLKKYNRLISLQKKKDLYSKEIIKTNLIIEKVADVKSISDNINKISSFTNSLNTLVHYNKLYVNIEKNINVGESYIDRFKNVDNIDGKISKLNNNLERLEKLNKVYKQYIINRNNIIKEEKSLNDIQLTIKEHLHKYQNILKKIEICPYCFSNIDENKIEHIINHYIGG